MMKMNKSLTLTIDGNKHYEHSLYRKAMQVIVSVEQKHPEDLIKRLVADLRQEVKRIGPDKFRDS
jgi:hypothetical protein